MTADVLIINGSPRAAGGTAAVVESLVLGLGDRSCATADLAALPMAHFSYDHDPEDDGFMQVVDQMLTARTIVFVTPVYWYAMSGLMKVFFDRLTDLILTKPRRPTGRALAGRDVWRRRAGPTKSCRPASRRRSRSPRTILAGPGRAVAMFGQWGPTCRPASNGIESDPWAQ